MRLFILILGGVEALIFISSMVANLLSLKHTDLAGQGLAQAYTIIFGVVLILFLLPALLLAAFNKLIWLALILLILSTLCMILAFMIF